MARSGRRLTTRLAQRLACVAAMLLATTVCLAAPAAPTSIRDYSHAGWTIEDGAPGGIWAITQTSDGWLWLGTASGLFRFDGLSFERNDLVPATSHQSRSVRQLLALPSGDLWVTYSSGSASLRPHGDPMHSLSPPGLPDGIAVDQLIADGNGDVWATYSDKSFRFDGHAWRPVSRRSVGLPAGDLAQSLDPDLTLWAVADDGFYAMRRGERNFTRIAKPLEAGSQLVFDRRGQAWQRQQSGMRRIAIAAASPPHGLAMPWSNFVIFDHDDALWSLACPSGQLCRHGVAEASTDYLPDAELDADHYGSADGMSAMAMTLFVDREGTVWVGTNLGLERFRARNLAPVRFKVPLTYFSMIPDREGGLWVGNASSCSDDTWQRLATGGDVSLAWPKFNQCLTAAYRDNDGSILLGGQHGVWRFDGKRMQSIAVPAALSGSKLQAIARDGRGRLWVSFRDHPLYQLDGTQWIAKGGIKALPDLPVARAVIDGRGRAWFGYTADRLVVLDGNSVRDFSEKDGLAIGTVTAILPDDPLPLVGGEQGLMAFNGQRFTALTSMQAEAFKGVTGLLRDQGGALWVNGNAGAARLEQSELSRGLANAAYRMAMRVFDADDGMPGGAQQIRPLPSLVRTDDGRLWFAATNGLAWLDPVNLRRNRQAPPISIRSFSAGGRALLPNRTSLHLGPNAGDLRIGFNVLSLAMPGKLQVRYRLLGYDGRWQDSGKRRDAFYTNLAPGSYRFEVAAANEDGVWNLRGDSIAFDIAPAFHQTTWFFVLCVGLGMILLWAAHRLRLRHIKTRLRQKMEVRHSERETIARDLHDTLLQGIHGLLLRLQTWAADSSMPPEHRRDIGAAAEQARGIVDEGRDRIVALRYSDAGQRGLAPTLRDIGEEYSALYPARFLLVEDGPARSLQAEAADEILAVMREAIRNAFAHAKATQIDVTVRHAPAQFSVVVCDDGDGIPADILRDGRLAGHWGLAGMRERASRLEANLSVTNISPHGVCVRLTVPARIAYAAGALSWWRRAFFSRR